MRKFQLKLKDGELERFHTGIPKLQVCIYNRKTKITTWRELVPQEYAEKILEKLHQIKIDTERMTCHPNSINKLTKKFNDTYYFRGINELARVFLKNCPTCKVSNPLPQTELPPPIPIRTFWPHQRLQFDLILLAVNKRKYLSNNIWGFKHILTVKCTFSKYIWLFPIISKEAEHVYTSLRFLCEKEGFPEIFQSDNGKEFVAKIITDFLKTHDVQIKHGRPYHPQSQGQVENANKVVKSHLNRILQHMTKDESARTWPLLLPGISSIMNNTWHQTIDDIPFRIYHNRDPIAMRHHIIPDDLMWLKKHTENVKENDGNSSTDDSESDEEWLEEGEISNKSNVGITANEIYQSCSSASLSSRFFIEKQEKSQQNDLEAVAAPIQSSGSNECQENEFDKLKFNTALYTLAKEKEYYNLQALEATEYGIHRNIQRRKPKNEERKFSLGDKVLIKNPFFEARKQMKDITQARNVVGTVSGVCSGGIYKVQLPNGKETYEKSVFQGQMVQYMDRDDECSYDANETPKKITYNTIMEAISTFGECTRENIYQDQKRYRRRDRTDISFLMMKYYEVLDYGVLMDMKEESEISSTYKEWDGLFREPKISLFFIWNSGLGKGPQM